jgi:CxxC-x17-CxxC domain-containing protein
VTYIDKTMTCRDCGQLFIWSSGEQEFFASRGLASPPSRCRDCRDTRRGTQTRMYDRTSGSDSYKTYGGSREMFTTTCSQCGNEARVPFIPRGHRPVYCSDCFAQMRTAERASSRY